MSSIHYVVLDSSLKTTRELFNLVESLKTANSQPQKKMLDFFWNQEPKIFLENSLRLRPETFVDFEFSDWLDEAGQCHIVDSESEAKQFNTFAQVNLASYLWGIEFVSYPPSNPLFITVNFKLPSLFLKTDDLTYRFLCREVINALAHQLQSTKSIYFFEQGEIESIYSSNYAVYNYGEKPTRSVNEFWDEVKRVGTLLDWEKDYSEIEEPDWYVNSYFADHYV